MFKSDDQQKSHRCRKSSVASDSFESSAAEQGEIGNSDRGGPTPTANQDINDSVMTEPSQDQQEVDDDINLDHLDTSSMEVEAEAPDLCDYDLIKIHYKQPKKGQKYFTVTSNGSVIGSTMREVDDGDYILYCNKSEIRELNAFEANRIFSEAKEHKWMTIIVLKSGHEDDEDFMELLR